ncbi:hypothetical protein BKA62DRAFT_192843 [Auriculariales sp. MPI-PUGE-AT-0066]|nr:hypothetical protein BKA62DRAFT_192843 [Auriculariales sp. MPI-PUGE-AT-0066]
MDEHLETSWCPACDRLIEPAKYLVELDDQNRQINILSSSNNNNNNSNRQSARQVVTRQPVAPGLVRGTGRVQPNGTLLSLLRDRAPRTQSDSDLPPPVPPPSPVMHRAAARASSASRARRTVVSQQQTPLYCSAACRARDADSLGIRRLSESTATSGSTGGRSVFDKAATSATSLESYDLPPRDPSPKKVSLLCVRMWVDMLADVCF